MKSLRLVGASRIVLAATVTFFLLFTLLPIYWMAISALKGPSDLFMFPPEYWPTSLTLDNFYRAMFETRLGALYVNSLIVAISVCLVLMVLIVLAAFALARFKFFGRSLLLAMFLIAQVLPPVALLVPMFELFRNAGILDTRLALIIVYVMALLPFSVMTMRSFILAVPLELEESAMIDGCSRLGAFFRVTLPAAVPGLVATVIYGFINAWNELLFAIILISSPKFQTLPVGLVSLADEQRNDYGVMLATAVLALLPSLALFGWVQRYLTGGLTAGAVKG